MVLRNFRLMETRFRFAAGNNQAVKLMHRKIFWQSTKENLSVKPPETELSKIYVSDMKRVFTVPLLSLYTPQTRFKLQYAD
jgi:hypothetical protein